MHEMVAVAGFRGSMASGFAALGFWRVWGSPMLVAFLS